MEHNTRVALIESIMAATRAACSQTDVAKAMFEGGVLNLGLIQDLAEKGIVTQIEFGKTGVRSAEFSFRLADHARPEEVVLTESLFTAGLDKQDKPINESILRSLGITEQIIAKIHAAGFTNIEELVNFSSAMLAFQVPGLTRDQIKIVYQALKSFQNPRNTKIEDMGFSWRVRNALTDAQLRTLGGILNLTSEEIAGIPGLGKKGREEIARKIDEFHVA